MILRLLLSSVLSLLLLCPALTASAQDEITVLTHADANGTPIEVGKLYPMGNNTYVNNISLCSHVQLRYKGQKYQVETKTDYWQKSPVGDVIEFKKTGKNQLYVNDYVDKYKLVATLSADESSIFLKFENPDPAKPVSAIVNQKKITILDDASFKSGIFEYLPILNSTKTPVTISDITFDDKTYRLQSQPTFTSAKEEGSQTISLVEGSGTTTLNVKGYYKLSLRVDNGTPTAIIIQKYSEDNRPVSNAFISPTFPESMIYCEDTGSYIPDEPLTLWFNTESWHQNAEVGNHGADHSEVFLLGNGRLGITLEGKQTEGILVNEKTNYDSNPDPNHNIVNTGTYNPIGYFKMTRNGEEPSGGSFFLRQLDLTTAVASAINRWTKDGTEKVYTREYFVSQPDDVAAIHLTTNGEVKLNYTFSSDLSGSATSDGFYSANGKNTGNCDIHFNLSFKVLQKGGQLSSSGSSVTVTDADEITVVFAVGTNYDIDSSTFYSGESDSEIAARVKSTVERAASLGWQQLYDNHIAEYSPLFNAASFELTDALNDAPSKDLKNHYHGMYQSDSADSDNQTRMVDMLLFAMGRYLNLASSRGDLALPSNLQGIWANSGPEWNCDFHANINLQMNYWASENTNISSAHMPFLNYLKKMAATQWRGYAEKIAPGCDGWVHHFSTNTFGASGMYNGNYSAGATWNCTHIWQHYLYTQDRQFLADYFDTLYSLAKFLFAYMKDVDNDGLLEVPEYYSPEINSGSTVAVHSQQLAYQHLCNTRDAALILGKTAEAEKCQQYIDKMYNGIDIKDGYQCEWKGELTSEATHRHLSHLMCLYPLAQVSPYDADLTNFEASYNSLLQRADADGGEMAAWNTAWKMACYARSLKGDLALRQLAYGMEQRITTDLRTTCKHSFQIEGGAGISAAIGEMLLQSYSGVIDILPALPSGWQSGSFRGLKAVGNYEVETTWENGEISEIKVTDCLNQAIRDGGVYVRVHTQTIPQGDITQIRLNGRSTANRYTFSYEAEPQTESYLVYIPAGESKTSVITFDGSDPTGIDDISTDNPADTNLPVELFDLQGRRVDSGNPMPGIYIRRQGSSVTKILIGAN